MRVYSLRACQLCGGSFKPTGGRELWCSLQCAALDKLDMSGGPNACWPCTNRPTRAGYVFVSARRETAYAHRVICELFHGPLKPGEYAIHSCDNPPCANPGHVRPGTPSDNSNDMYRRGRQGDRNYATGPRHGNWKGKSA